MVAHVVQNAGTIRGHPGKPLAGGEYRTGPTAEGMTRLRRLSAPA
jgi:hypothetical protein